MCNEDDVVNVDDERPGKRKVRRRKPRSFQRGSRVKIPGTFFDDPRAKEEDRFSNLQKIVFGTVLSVFGRVVTVKWDDASKSFVSVDDIEDADKVFNEDTDDDVDVGDERPQKQNIDDEMHNEDDDVNVGDERPEKRNIDDEMHNKDDDVNVGDERLEKCNIDDENHNKDDDVDIVDNARHQKQVDNDSIADVDEACASGSNIDGVIKKSDLFNGEEVYLIDGNKPIFKARYEKTPSGTTVHGRIIKKTEVRCFITKVMQKAVEYKHFDMDVHCVGAAIIWSLEGIKKMKVKEVEVIGTEGQVPNIVERGSGRKRKPETWWTSRKKSKINRGEEFSHKRRDGTEIKRPARQMKGPCKPTCRKTCGENLTEAQREEIFSSYWELGDKYAQWSYIRTYVQGKKPERRRTRKDIIKRRSEKEFSFKYNLPCEADTIEVCQIMFLQTLGISRKMVLNVFRKVGGDGTLKMDKRGRKEGTRFILGREEVVMKHIKMFKCVESHYVRKNSKCQYLPQELTLREMYRMYLEWCSKECYNQENYDFYKRTFNTRFKLKFQKPKKDICSTCSAYKNTVEKTEDDDAKQKKHREDKETARSIKAERKEEAKGDEFTSCAAFDLQQVLLSPYGQTSDFYYCRRLKNHNLTITEIDTMNTYCNLWNESEGNKGACEVATAIFKFLEVKKKEGVDRVYFFCDACGGQNRNRMVFIMMSYAMRVFNFDFIDLSFLVSGHSQNENDTAHSVIEQHTKKLTIYTPSQWETNIQNSFKSNECHINVLKHQDIINFKSKESFPDYSVVLADKAKYEVEIPARTKAKTRFDISNFVKGKKTQKKIMWSHIVNARFQQTAPEKIYFKYDYNDEFLIADFCTASNVSTLLKRSKKKLQLYQKPIGISKLKKESLVKLCDKNLIPQQHQEFYRNIPENNRNDDDDNANVKVSK